MKCGGIKFNTKCIIEKMNNFIQLTVLFCDATFNMVLLFGAFWSSDRSFRRRVGAA